MKNHKIDNNSATTEAREKISAYLESLEFYKCFDLCLAKFENYQYLLDKICHRFLVTIKLFSGWKNFIMDVLTNVNKPKGSITLKQLTCKMQEAATVALLSLSFLANVIHILF